MTEKKGHLQHPSRFTEHKDAGSVASGNGANEPDEILEQVAEQHIKEEFERTLIAESDDVNLSDSESEVFDIDLEADTEPTAIPDDGCSVSLAEGAGSFEKHDEEDDRGDTPDGNAAAEEPGSVYGGSIHVTAEMSEEESTEEFVEHGLRPPPAQPAIGQGGDEEYCIPEPIDSAGRESADRETGQYPDDSLVPDRMQPHGVRRSGFRIGPSGLFFIFLMILICCGIIYQSFFKTSPTVTSRQQVSVPEQYEDTIDFIAKGRGRGSVEIKRPVLDTGAVHGIDRSQKSQTTAEAADPGSPVVPAPHIPAKPATPHEPQPSVSGARVGKRAEREVIYYTIQVDVLSRRSVAKSLYQRLRLDGFPVYVIKEKNNDGALFYTIRVGTYTTREKAEKVVSSLQSVDKKSYSILKITGVDVPEYVKEFTTGAVQQEYAGGVTYSVHAGSFKTEERADSEIARLKGFGFDAYKEQVKLSKKGIWYRVKIGKFPSLQDARETQKMLKEKDPSIESRITKET